MKKWLPILVLSVLLQGCSDADKLTLASGETLSLVAGKYTAVSYWASWCKPCRDETIQLNHLNNELAGKLNLIGVNFDHEIGPKLRQSMLRLGILYPVVVSDVATRWHLPEPQVLPTIYLLSPEHQLVKTFYGEDGVEELKAWLSKR